MGTFNSRSFAQRGFPTFAAAGTATGLTSNTIYHVGGKTTVGDTYAGLFTYVPDDSTAASDDVIVVTGGRLKRQSFDSIVQGSPQLIEGQVALPSDVVNAIGSAVNEAIRDEGALPVAGAGGASATDINNALKGSAQPTRTQVSSSQMIQVQTAANGTSWASFPVAPCQTITIYNQTGVRIRVGLDSSPTIYTVLEPDMGIPLATPNNSSNARVKRDDESTTQVAVTALAVL